MALGDCVECAGTVSTLARACPHCGAPAVRKREVAEIAGVRAFVAVAIYVVLVLMLMYAIPQYAMLLPLVGVAGLVVAYRRKWVRIRRPTDAD